MISFLRARATLTLLLGLAGLAACGGGDGTGPDGDGDGDGGTGTLLTSGTPLTGRSGGEGDETVYRIVVPTGATLLAVTTTGGTGDLDLYVRRDQVPTESTYDCQSSGGDNEETCNVDTPAAGTWYIMLQGFEAYSGVTLVATVTGGAGGGGGGGGGATDGYTLSVTPASPVLTRGGSTQLTVTAARSGYTGAIALSAQNLPSGVAAGTATIAAGSNSTTLGLTATTSATLGTATITVKGVASGLTDRTATASLSVAAVSGTAVTWRSVSMGNDHACGVTTANVGYCWGARHSGQIGDGQPTSGSSYTTPKLVAGGHQWAEISAGGSFTCGRTTANLAYCWGSNSLGRTGTGSTDHNATLLVPTAVAYSGTIQQIAAGNSHGCLLTTGGDVYCWGDNSISEKVTTSGSYIFTPVQAAAGRAYSQIATGGGNSCALTATGGAVWCWGANGQGQLGIGSSSFQDGPRQVQGGPYTQIVAGSHHLCALTAAGAAYCWGGNVAGEVGVATPDFNSSMQTQSTPVLVGGGLTFKQLVAGSSITCGLTTAGATSCWGTNANGRFGNGSSTPVQSATPSPAASGMVFQALGRDATSAVCGTTAAGASWCWGVNTSFKLGAETSPSTESNVPVRVNNPA